MIRNSRTASFLPVGLTDSSDQVESFAGACQAMQNVVFNKSDWGSIVPRPGVTQTASLLAGGFISPTNIVIAKEIGNRIYGIVSTSRYAGKDEPFCYDSSTGTFISIGNVLSTNTPNTMPTTGTYVPPTMDLVGVYLIFTHSGATGTDYIYWIDTSATTLTWNAGNTSVNPLPSRPLAVAQFNERAYYLCGNMLYFSDVLLPLNVSFPGNALTIGNSRNGTALCGLPIKTTTQGILEALLVFKENSIWQVTGDYATGNLALNQISQSFGCIAPMTVAPVLEGVAFMAEDGIRLVNAGTFDVSLYTVDVLLPFMNCTAPSRACAAYNNGIYRICLDTVIDGVVETRADYWYDTLRKRWTGIHSFGYDQITPWGISFAVFSSTAPGYILQSDVVPTNATTYSDIGVAYTCFIQTTNLSDTGEMAVKAIIETTLDLRVQNSSMLYTVQALNDNQQVLGTATITTPSSGNLWGQGLWGQGLWTATPTPYDHTFSVDWANPIVYKKLNYTITVTASSGVVVERMFWREQVLGYTNIDTLGSTYFTPRAAALLQDNGAYILQSNGYRISL